MSEVHRWLRVEQEGPLLTVSLSNPAERNPQVPSMWTALAEVGESLPSDVRVVVLRGDGQAFSAGLHRALLAPGGMPDEPDVVALAASAPDLLDRSIAGWQRGFAVWRSVPAVVLAVVQGYAVGAGFQLALAADLRILADDAQLAMRETSLGLVPDLGGTGPLVQAVGYARALEICATGRFVGASEAKDIGLANLVVPRAELDASAGDLVSAILGAPRAAVRALKPLLAGAVERSAADQLAAERLAQADLLQAMAARLS